MLYIVLQANQLNSYRSLEQANYPIPWKNLDLCKTKTATSFP